MLICFWLQKKTPSQTSSSVRPNEPVFEEIPVVMVYGTKPKVATHKAHQKAMAWATFLDTTWSQMQCHAVRLSSQATRHSEGTSAIFPDTMADLGLDLARPHPPCTQAGGISANSMAKDPHPSFTKLPATAENLQSRHSKGSGSILLHGCRFSQRQKVR